MFDTILPITLHHPFQTQVSYSMLLIKAIDHPMFHFGRYVASSHIPETRFLRQTFKKQGISHWHNYRLCECLRTMSIFPFSDLASSHFPKTRYGSYAKMWQNSHMTHVVDVWDNPTHHPTPFPLRCLNRNHFSHNVLPAGRFQKNAHYGGYGASSSQFSKTSFFCQIVENRP